MLGAAFEAEKIPATFEKFDVMPEDLGKFVEQLRSENIRGLSVTIPHKMEIMQYLDEIEEHAKKIHAVNTIFWKGELLCGTNTDWIGALTTLETKTQLENKKVVVLGGGGAAHALVYALLQAKVQELVVLTREAWEFEDLQKKFPATTYDFVQNLEKYSPDILINTTPLGMKGKFEGQSFVPKEYFTQHKPLVFDIVYTPAETKLLADARTAGCETLEGLGMLVRQGAKQFEIWTGKRAPVEIMWAAAEKALQTVI
jgi:shikimate dehydrogenase